MVVFTKKGQIMCFKRSSVALCLSVFTLSLQACSNRTSSTANNAATAAAIVENLSAADKLDGSEDHVIAKCYSCALAMDGATNISTEYHDYTIHHCSEACKEKFAEKADSLVARTKIPAPESERVEVNGTQSE